LRKPANQSDAFFAELSDGVVCSELRWIAVIILQDQLPVTVWLADGAMPETQPSASRTAKECCRTMPAKPPPPFVNMTGFS
jgi:uncharacterized protein (DUF924 family)